LTTIDTTLQDTIRKPKTGSEAGQMKKATTLAIFITTGFYMAVGTMGYGAFGDEAPTNLLTGFGFFNPYWLIDIANVFIMVHLVGAYQVNIAPYPLQSLQDLPGIIILP
jgi:amino acid permease